MRFPDLFRLALLLGLIAAEPPAIGAGQQNELQVSLNPAVTLTLRIADGRRQFRAGEIIPIELAFESDVRRRFAVDGATYDRSGRLTIDEFHLSPLSDVTDPLLDYLGTMRGIIGGGLSGTGQLGDKPYTVSLELNDWFRFDTPGTYKLSVRSNRVSDETQQTSTPRTIAVESNAISFEIVAADKRWEDLELTRAVQTLQSGGSIGCRILRFLGTDAAVEEMIRRYGDQGCGFDATAGLFSAPHRDFVVKRLEAGLHEPDIAVTRSYLRTLAVLSVYAQHPELRVPQTPDRKGRLATGGEISRRPELIEAEEARYAGILGSELGSKTGAARAISTVEYADYVRDRARTTGAPSANAALNQLVSVFADLPETRQRSLLEYEWEKVAGAEWLPILRGLADRSEPLSDLALRRLYQLAPEEGRTRILAEIKNPPSNASLTTLGALPDTTLPEFDEVIAARLERNLTDIGTRLLYRYASPAVALRLLARFRNVIGRMACDGQSYVLAYFLRAVPRDGAELLERALASRSDTGCFQSVLLDTATLHMTPELEAAAIAHLDDEHSRVVLNAIDTLGRYGSPGVIRPLRTRFEKWHREWSGRPNELRNNAALGERDQRGAVNGLIESAFIRALAARQSGLGDERERRALRDLCVTDACRGSVDAMRNRAPEAVK
jgi:hypothetical protein